MKNKFVIDANAKAPTDDGICRAYFGMSFDNLVKEIKLHGVDSLIEKKKESENQCKS